MSDTFFTAQYVSPDTRSVTFDKRSSLKFRALIKESRCKETIRKPELGTSFTNSVHFIENANASKRKTKILGKDALNSQVKIRHKK